MVTNIAQFTRRGISSLAALSMGLSLLALSACGGGAPSFGAGSTPTPATGLMVSSFAGSGSSIASLGEACGVVSDGANLYVADTANNLIRKVVLATGAISTLAGQLGVAGAADGAGTAATFNGPSGMAIDGAGANLYVVDLGNNKIRKIAIATGAVSTLAGTGAYGATDGAGTAATFSYPYAIATDGAALYVTDTWNAKIRKVDIATGAVSTLAGSGALGAADGAGASATFSGALGGIATDGVNLYVADGSNNKIRKIVISSGLVSSFTGSPNVASAKGAADGAASSASFNWPEGIATDGVNLYVTDGFNVKIRQIVISSGQVSSLTGLPNTPSAHGYADGAASAATFNLLLWGIVAVNGSIYVADTQSNGPPSDCILRKVTGGAVSSVPFPSPDGIGAAATFSQPFGVTSDGVNLYVADPGTNTIRKVAIASGQVTTLAGSPLYLPGAADGTGMAASFNAPYGIATDGTSLYVADAWNNKIRKITPASGSLSAMTSANAVVTSFTGGANVAVSPGQADGAATSASFWIPAGIATDGVNLYVADTYNQKIRAIAIATGVVSSLTGPANTGHGSGAADGAASSALFYMPMGVATDGTNLYVADTHNNKIRKIVLATGAVSSLTGTANTPVTAGAADGAASSASFHYPEGIATDGTNLYVADTSNFKIRKIAVGAGTVSSLTGVTNTTSAAGYVNGPASSAAFSGPVGIVVAGGSVYVADTNNHTIRKIQ